IRLLDEPDDQPGARVRRIGGLTLWAETLVFQTTAAREFLDVTDQVAAIVRRSRISQGWVSAFSKHTTAAVVLQENEPLLLQDMSGLLDKFPWYKQSACKWKGEGITVYIDAWGLRPQEEPADVIFITHANADAYEPEDIDKIKKSTPHYIAPPDVAEKLKGNVKAVRP